jgi:hypothetical protein
LRRLVVNYHRGSTETLPMKDIAISIFKDVPSLWHLELLFLSSNTDLWPDSPEHGVYEVNRCITTAEPGLLVRSHGLRLIESLHGSPSAPLANKFSGWIKDMFSKVAF